MSGQRLTRGKRIIGKLGTAAVVATLSAAPSVAFAGKPPSPPPPPPPPPAAPQPAPLNADPNVHWFAAWDENTAPGSTDFFATPSTSTGLANVQFQLNGSATAGKPLGIKVESPIPSATATSLFNTQYTGGKAISYVFGDIETSPVKNKAAVVSDVTNLVNQVRNSTWSKNAYVGNFGFVPLTGIGNELGQDPTRRSTTPATFGKAEYDASKVNMANTVLYPGTGDFRNKSTGDWGNANIRTGLFFAPIGRMTAVQNALNAGYNGSATTTVGTGFHKQIPWVSRFNNWGNSSLDTDNNPANGYRFQPGVAMPHVGLSAAQTANQMIGRGDFSAQIQHYRMRGAYSVNLFHEGAQGSAEGYSSAMAKQDVRDGWYGVAGSPIAHANNIFAQADNKPATMTLNPQVDGTSSSGGMRAEVTGTIWSGVYSLSLKQLDILASNLDSTPHMIKFGTVDAYEVFAHKDSATGYTYSDSGLTSSRNALIESLTHRLLQFDLVTTRVYNNLGDIGSNDKKKYTTQTIWLLNQNYSVFTNNNRNDVGIPEPTTFGMLAAAGSMAVICRRNRSKKPA
ncbi:MAG TPA: PEP-CTERM sorting domain-containing protein [Tepidisphaeraceae bacterium]|nr:PEP-CTERM sorting domain-containing protein [Tepidisphaeraceae bacterium]